MLAHCQTSLPDDALRNQICRFETITGIYGLDRELYISLLIAPHSSSPQRPGCRTSGAQPREAYRSLSKPWMPHDLELVMTKRCGETCLWHILFSNANLMIDKVKSRFASCNRSRCMLNNNRGFIKTSGTQMGSCYTKEVCGG